MTERDPVFSHAVKTHSTLILHASNT